MNKNIDKLNDYENDYLIDEFFDETQEDLDEAYDEQDGDLASSSRIGTSDGNTGLFNSEE